MDYAARGNRWIDKSPQNLYCIHLLHRYIEGASFIHIVREGKANVASLVDAGIKYKMFRSRFGGPDGIDKAIHFYNSSLRMTKRYGGRKRHVVVRYEDLAEDPQTTLTPVENLLGISINSDVLSYRTEGIITLDEVWKCGGPEIRLRKSKFTQVFSSDEQEYVSSRILDVEKWFPTRINQEAWS